MHSAAPTSHVAIACGGTGGHLFPGLAVADRLVQRGCAVTLLVSPKEVDQLAVKDARHVAVVTLPAFALQSGGRLAFLRGCWRSWRAARACFQARPPEAVLAMGGFTSAPPILAARRLGAKTFLHESNSIPGRANRWLARFVDQAFVGFPSAALRLRAREITVTGTPVRPEFRPGDTAARRAALGFDPARPVVLVTGGSQGARAVNEMILAALPLLVRRAPHWQWLHLTGPNDLEKVRQTCARLGVNARVFAFLAEMHLALGAATAAVSRAGASSLAELAALQLPALLVPYPFAADNHQLHNARAFAKTGAAWLLEQRHATPEQVADQLWELVENAGARGRMQSALAQWHAPNAAEQIAQVILKACARSADRRIGAGQTPSAAREPNDPPAAAVEQRSLSAA
jgi:UDP-N-acetylglucosamine--N-acetylmuramyl-(pentapeptide) pyrophosphoryl-undecaprenol N-acetylglucosamine transferase